MKIKISLPTEAERAKVLETCFNSQKISAIVFNLRLGF